MMSHALSFSFINDEGLVRIFRPNDAMKTAWKLLEIPRAKEFLEAMLLVHVPILAIAAYVWWAWLWAGDDGRIL